MFSWACSLRKKATDGKRKFRYFVIPHVFRYRYKRNELAFSVYTIQMVKRMLRYFVIPPVSRYRYKRNELTSSVCICNGSTLSTS
jgi:hypothetical protein